MATSKKPSPIATFWITGVEAQQYEYKFRAVHRGRRRTFNEPTTRLNYMLPVSLVEAVRQDALDAGKTASEIIAAILQSQYQC
jgi:hypothetical protein